jgi:hypothetical protein
VFTPGKWTMTSPGLENRTRREKSDLSIPPPARSPRIGHTHKIRLRRRHSRFRELARTFWVRISVACGTISRLIPHKHRNGV